MKEIAAEVGEVVVEKNIAYGSSFEKCGDFLKLLYPDGIRPEQYTDALLIVRMFDKMMRIASRKDAFGESPYKDMAGYAVCGTLKDEPGKPVVKRLTCPHDPIGQTLHCGVKTCSVHNPVNKRFGPVPPPDPELLTLIEKVMEKGNVGHPEDSEQR